MDATDAVTGTLMEQAPTWEQAFNEIRASILTQEQIGEMINRAITDTVKSAIGDRLDKIEANMVSQDTVQSMISVAIGDKPSTTQVEALINAAILTATTDMKNMISGMVTEYQAASNASKQAFDAMKDSVNQLIGEVRGRNHEIDAMHTRLNGFDEKVLALEGDLASQGFAHERIVSIVLKTETAVAGLDSNVMLLVEQRQRWQRPFKFVMQLSEKYPKLSAAVGGAAMTAIVPAAVGLLGAGWNWFVQIIQSLGGG